jgi:hypothetical protein
MSNGKGIVSGGPFVDVLVFVVVLVGEGVVMLMWMRTNQKSLVPEVDVCPART